MTKPMNLNVRLTGALSDFVSTNVAGEGAYDNVSEYVRDLIRRDKDRADREAFERLKAELKLAFAAPDGAYRALEADTVIGRNRAR